MDIKNKLKPVPVSNKVTPNFTKDQEIAVNALIDFISSPYNEKDYRRALVGAAGTGKTFVLKYVINNCSLSHSTIGLAAPTHKACRVLRESTKLMANTIQSDLGLRLNFDVDKFDIDNPPFDPMGKMKINKYALYIIDEASMINRGLLTLIERECKKARCKIIYVGDESQLAPVGELYSPAFKGVKAFKLTQIVRQGDDNPISYLLELLRRDIKNNTFTFLSYIGKNDCKFNEAGDKGYCVFNASKFPEIVEREFNTEEFVNNIDLSKVVGFTNVCVNSWNTFIRNSIVKDANKSIITKHDLITSYVTIVDDFNDAIIKNSEEYIIKDVVNYTHSKYELEGFMVRFIAVHGGVVTQPLFILNHTHKESLVKYYQICNSYIEAAKNATKALRSAKWKEYYKFKDSVLLLTNIGDSNGKIIIGRDLDYGFSITSHKSQGSTYNVSLVDVNDIVYDKFGQPYTNAEEINRRLYVACSRAKNKLYLKYGY